MLENKTDSSDLLALVIRRVRHLPASVLLYRVLKWGYTREWQCGEERWIYRTRDQWIADTGLSIDRYKKALSFLQKIKAAEVRTIQNEKGRFTLIRACNFDLEENESPSKSTISGPKKGNESPKTSKKSAQKGKKLDAKSRKINAKKQKITPKMDLNLDQKTPQKTELISGNFNPEFKGERSAKWHHKNTPKVPNGTERGAKWHFALYNNYNLIKKIAAPIGDRENSSENLDTFSGEKLDENCGEKEGGFPAPFSTENYQGENLGIAINCTSEYKNQTEEEKMPTVAEIMKSPPKKPFSLKSQNSVNLPTTWLKARASDTSEYQRPLTKKEQGQLNKFAKDCPEGIAENVVQSCLSNWALFVGYVKQSQGITLSPAQPSIGYFVKYRSEAIQFHNRSSEQKVNPSLPNKKNPKTADPCLGHKPFDPHSQKPKKVSPDEMAEIFGGE